MGENASYGTKAEAAFIDGAEWSARRRKSGMSYVEWLRRYLQAHQGSDRDIHVFGVDYVRRKLEGFRRGE